MAGLAIVPVVLCVFPARSIAGERASGNDISELKSESFLDSKKFIVRELMAFELLLCPRLLLDMVEPEGSSSKCPDGIKKE